MTADDKHEDLKWRVHFTFKDCIDDLDLLKKHELSGFR